MFVRRSIFPFFMLCSFKIIGRWRVRPRSGSLNKGKWKWKCCAPHAKNCVHPIYIYWIKFRSDQKPSWVNVRPQNRCTLNIISVSHPTSTSFFFINGNKHEEKIFRRWQFTRTWEETVCSSVSSLQAACFSLLPFFGRFMDRVWFVRCRCLPCRKKKMRCDGSKPICSHCSKLGMSLHCLISGRALMVNYRTWLRIQPESETWITTWICCATTESYWYCIALVLFLTWFSGVRSADRAAESGATGTADYYETSTWRPSTITILRL